MGDVNRNFLCIGSVATFAMAAIRSSDSRDNCRNAVLGAIVKGYKSVDSSDHLGTMVWL